MPRRWSDAIAATNLDTVVGKVQWNGANLPPFAAKNVAKTPLVGGQWRLKDGNKYDIVITDNRDRAEHSGRRQDGGDRLTAWRGERSALGAGLRFRSDSPVLLLNSSAC